MLKNLSVIWKLWLLIGVTSFFGVVVLVTAAVVVKDVEEMAVDRLGEKMLAGHEEKIKSVVDATIASWATELAECATEEERVAAIRRMNAPVRYLENRSGYLFVYEKGGTVLDLPVKTELVGTNMWDSKDPNGVQFVAELEKVALAGGGFVEYVFSKPGSATPQPKISYATAIPGTDYWAGSGVYVDDVQLEQAAVAAEFAGKTKAGAVTGLIIVLLVFAGGVVPLSIYISRLVIGPLRQIARSANALREGDVGIPVQYEAKDELGQTAEAFRQLTQALRDRSELAMAIADGDLTRDVQVFSHKDLLGTAIRRMSDSLNQLLHRIATASHEVNTGSNQISQASQALAEGATRSAANLQEISASLVEVSSQAQGNADDAESANKLASEARSAADEGASKIADMVAAMGEINESSQAITKVIQAIDDIAFKTNLLALNAAVEAARAGQHGKGFAVVAEEVRTLAGQSAKAARESAGLLEDSRGKVERGSRIADETASGLQAILASSQQVADLVGNIAEASTRQANGVNEINSALQQIDNVTQQNSAHAEETAAGTEELSGQAEELRSMISHFKLKDAGRSSYAGEVDELVESVSYAH